MNFYNEIDAEKAEWLRQLMARNVIPMGVVDDRSIEEIEPAELVGFTQYHFFAGIGLWAYALRLAGWPDDRPCWTGSCPCQPFSVAGKQKGTLDERHLWPAWFRLITERRPRVVFGEQVADGDGIAWLDNVQTDMESKGYCFGPLVLPAAGFGAPHGRHRLMFVADTAGVRFDRGGAVETGTCERKEQQHERFRDAGELGNASEYKYGARDWKPDGDDRHQPGRDGARSTGSTAAAGPCNGFWADAEWIPCRGKIPGTVEWRPIKPSAQPMADGPASDILRMCDYGFALVKGGTEARTLSLKGYGDGICAPAVAEFIKAYAEIIGVDTLLPKL